MKFYSSIKNKIKSCCFQENRCNGDHYFEQNKPGLQNEYHILSQMWILDFKHTHK